MADTYTGILNGNFSVHSLTLGGPNGTQTLVLPAANLTFSLGADSAVTPNGVFILGDSGGGFSVLGGAGDRQQLADHLRREPLGAVCNP